MLRCWYGVQSVPGNYTQHHYNPTTSKAGWIFNLILHQIRIPTIQMLQQTHPTRLHFSNLWLCLNFLFHLRERHSLWSSAAEVHLLQESVYCTFKYGLLHSLAVWGNFTAGLVAQSASCHDTTLKSHPPSHTFCIWHSHTNMRLMHQGKLGVQYFGQGYLA